MSLALFRNMRRLTVHISNRASRPRKLRYNPPDCGGVPMKRWSRAIVGGILAAASLIGVAPIQVAHSQAGYPPSQSNLDARRWFQDAKFGMFIHWGVYSVLGDGEWVEQQRPITKHDYEKLPAFFNPQKFDAAAVVGLAKAAGMKYITVTTKHHDGFAMWDTKQSDWSIVARTPYGKDAIKQLADECHKQGLKIFFYYSQLDWHNDDYYPRGTTGNSTGRPDSGDWNKYLDYMNGQLRELLTNYGEVGGIWFDGMWDKPNADWKLATTYSLIHQLQPAALVGSNHHHKPYPGEDFQMFERDVPGGMNASWNKDETISQLPLETCDTMNGAWGFNLTDDHYKSTTEVVRYLVKAAGNNANLLLNIGPMPNGEVQPEFVSRLHEVGDWTAKYGESIYGTRGGPLPPASWGVTTQKDGRIYIHILDWSAPEFAIAPITPKITSAHLLVGSAPVSFAQTSEGVVLKLSARQAGEIDQVVVLETQPTK
jgi:alpha-L-fucosidase